MMLDLLHFVAYNESFDRLRLPVDDAISVRGVVSMPFLTARMTLKDGADKTEVKINAFNDVYQEFMRSTVSLTSEFSYMMILTNS